MRISRVIAVIIMLVLAVTSFFPALPAEAKPAVSLLRRARLRSRSARRLIYTSAAMARLRVCFLSNRGMPLGECLSSESSTNVRQRTIGG